MSKQVARFSPPLVVFTSVFAAAHPSRSQRILLWLLCLTCAAGAHAMERVTLRNGFAYDCTRQESLDSTHIRLFLLEADPKAAPNYIDLPAGAVANVEILPDPPKAVPGSPMPPLSVANAATPDVGTILRSAGAAHDIDVELLASIMHAESGGRPNAVSRVGAVGLMQLMPATALSLGVLNASLPEGNINGGTAYLDALLTRYKNNLALALAAYNAGPGAVDRYHGIPPFRETRAYVVRVMTEFKRRKLELARNEHAER